MLRVLDLTLLAVRGKRHNHDDKHENRDKVKTHSATPTAPASVAVLTDVFGGCRRLFGILLATPSLADAMFTDATMLNNSATMFTNRCAMLLVPGGGINNTGNGSAPSSSATPSAVGAAGVVGAASSVKYYNSDDDATEPTSAMPEALRLVRSEAVLEFARLVCQQPRCRDYPLVERVARLVSTEKSLTVRSKLAMALQMLQNLTH